ncbi:hypothetical protein AMD24_00518 [Candidatus Xiphinematobacter sp. Idaho Grape]|nr:hypothetical protein AMD24_00518 [Candidatus Xiphinematobacter sp. Idaho Grape]
MRKTQDWRRLRPFWSQGPFWRLVIAVGISALLHATGLFLFSIASPTQGSLNLSPVVVYLLSTEIQRNARR